MDSETDDMSHLKGVVIITLPPIDNPSIGKTITAFTVPISDYDPPNQNPPPPQPNSNPILPATFLIQPQRSFLSNPKALFLFLAVSIFFYFFVKDTLTKSLIEFQQENDREERERGDEKMSFLLPLFRNGSVFGAGDLEAKLGRFKDVGDGKSGLEFGASLAVSDKSAVFPVRGSADMDGLYFTYLLIGNPPQPYFLDMDTGSDLTWIQCDAPCTSCAKGPHPLYKPSRSNLVPCKDSLCTEVQGKEHTATCQQCDYEVEYADRSSSLGVLARDALHLRMPNGTRTATNLAFGCAYDQRGILLNSLARTDGILGLSRARVSLPSQLASQGKINNVVGHCLSATADSGGYMFLGDEFVPQSGMSWVPMLHLRSTNSYNAEIAKLSYGKNKLYLGKPDKDAPRVVFDSGSSHSYFTKQAYSDLLISLEGVPDHLTRDVSDPTLPICWCGDSPIRSISDVKDYFKTITLQFGSKWWPTYTRLHIPPEGYLIISNKGNVCLGILDGSTLQNGPTIMLGDISLRSKLIVYDNVKSQIGWTQSNCVKPDSINTKSSAPLKDASI